MFIGAAELVSSTRKGGAYGQRLDWEGTGVLMASRQSSCGALLLPGTLVSSSPSTHHVWLKKIAS